MSECRHNWLVPDNMRTTCIRCGRDGYIYLDVDPSDRIATLETQIQLSQERIEAVTAERDEMERELEDLRWFRDRVNERVIPGTTDTHDAAREFINCYLGNYRKLEAQVASLKEQLDQAKTDMALTGLAYKTAGEERDALAQDVKDMREGLDLAHKDMWATVDENERLTRALEKIADQYKAWKDPGHHCDSKKYLQAAHDIAREALKAATGEM